MPSKHWKLVYNNVFCFCEFWSERFVASADRRCSPTPLCDTLSCVHLHNEGLHRGLLSRRGPVEQHRRVVMGPRFSSCLLALTENRCHFHTLLHFTCSDDSCVFLQSSSPASQCHSHCGQLRLRVLFLTLLCCIARGSDPPFGILRARLSAECGYPSLWTWLYLAVGGLASVNLCSSRFGGSNCALYLA